MTVVHLPVGKDRLKLVSILPPAGSLPDLPGAGHGAHLGAGQCRCQGACPVQQLRVGSCPAMQEKMVLGVPETVGTKASMVLCGGTVRAGVCVALGRIATCKGWRADGISKTPNVPVTDTQLPAAPFGLRPCPCPVRREADVKGSWIRACCSTVHGNTPDCSPLLGARQGPPGRAGILTCARQRASTQSGLAQLSCRNLVHNSSVPALLRYNTWIAP